MQSNASTVSEYLAALPDDRRAAIEAVRDVILQNLDSDFEEGMQYGMIGYYVPHRVFAAGYHCDPKQPLPMAGLASQKNYMSLYLMTCYGEGEHWNWFHDAWAASGKKLDMGKCCIRFKKLEDLALDVIAEAFRRTSAQGYLERYQAMLRDRPGKKAGDSKEAVKPKKSASSKAKAKAPTKKATKASKKKSKQGPSPRLAK